MAIPFLNHLDLRSVSELQNAILHKTTSSSASDVEGKIIYDTGSDSLKYYNGSAWINLDGSGDISAVNTASGSGLSGGATSGAVNLQVVVDDTTLEISTNTIQAKTAAMGELETLKASLDGQKMVQEAEIKKQLMQVEFGYNMQLRSMDTQTKQMNEKEKEDRKDQRTKIQATQQSEMIDQRNSGKPPKNFESSGNDILGGGFDLGSFDPR